MVEWDIDFFEGLLANLACSSEIVEGVEISLLQI